MTRTINLGLRREKTFDAETGTFIPLKIDNMGPATKMYVQRSLVPQISQGFEVDLHGFWPFRRLSLKAQ